MKAYKLEVLILDFDDLRAEAIRQVIERTRYPNDSVNPSVMAIREADIGDWTDEHPLNKKSTAKAEYDRLFSAAPPAAPVAAVPDDLLSDKILRALYRDAQRGFSCERVHAAIMAIIAQHATPPSDGVTSPADGMSPHWPKSTQEAIRKWDSMPNASAGPTRQHDAIHSIIDAAPLPVFADPADQAVGVDTPEFERLLARITSPGPVRKRAISRSALIAHITSLVTSARQEGREKALEEADKWRDGLILMRAAAKNMYNKTFAETRLRMSSADMGVRDAATAAGEVFVAALKETEFASDAASQPGEQGEG